MNGLWTAQGWQPPEGWTTTANWPGWWLNPQGDAGSDESWWQPPQDMIPDGFAPDAGNPGWYLRIGSDPAQPSSWWHDSTVRDEPPQRTGVLRGIDVASYQPADLTATIQKAKAEHVVIRMYQRSLEGERLQQHSRAQVMSAVAAGASVSTPYLWLYSSAPPSQQVNEAIDLAQSCGIGLKLMFLDVEPYTDGSLPSAAQIQAALAACDARGVRGAIYSGAWVWPRLGNPSFPGVPCWWASYDHVPEMNVAVPGGMVLVGKQYDDRLPSGEALDVDVFDASVI